MWKSQYKDMNEKILPKPMSRERILEKAAPHRPKRVRMAVMAAVLALVIVAMPAMAGYVPAVSELMYQVAPEMAARFTPVLESCTVDGIRMEVVSASIHGATAEVCVSFEDLQGDRVNGSLREEGMELLGRDVFRSGNWGSSVGSFDYDEATGKAIMVIQQNYSFYDTWKGRYLTVEELFNGKITVCVDRLYRMVRGADGEWTEQTLAEGPWRVSFEISESDFVGERDDGVPLTTGLE